MLKPIPSWQISCRRSVLFAATLAALLSGEALAQQLPDALLNFKAVQVAPVFSGAVGQWDSLIRERGWIMKSRDRYRMWYTGYNPEVTPTKMKLGYATSSDGIKWTRHPSNPIFDDVWVEDMMIVEQADTLYMFTEGAGDQSQLLTSTDGIRWKRQSTLDVRLADGSPIPAGPFGTPTAWYEDGTWYLFYERRDQGIWLATSQDMKVWTNVSDAPLIVPGPDNYDKLMIAMNQVVKIDGFYYAVMHGTGTPAKPRDWCTYFAVSSDLKTWKKCTGGPVLPVKDNKSSGVLVKEENGFRLYTMHAKVDLHQ